MSLLTVSQVRDHVETGMIDGALERFLDAQDADIIRRLGPLATNTQVLPGGNLYLYLSRKSSAIVDSVVERVFADGFISGSPTEFDLEEDDYSLLSDGYRVERLNDGTNPATGWRGEVTIVSTPTDETAQRKSLLIKLIMLDVRYDGVSKETREGASIDYLSYAAEVDKLFVRAGRRGRLPFA